MEFQGSDYIRHPVYGWLPVANTYNQECIARQRSEQDICHSFYLLFNRITFENVETGDN